VIGVETTAGLLEADVVVNAAGAWAGAVARTMGEGLTDLGLVPYRRHLFHAVPPRAFDPSWPWVWDIPHNVYFRVDEQGATISPCDETPHEPTAPEIDPGIADELARTLELAFPAIASFPRRALHACLRTFAPDRKFVIGPDPRLEGFFWVAALGGCGVTAGILAGEMAARMILGRAVDESARRAFDPGRLAGGS
jgi:D-arginine dehydrogenase